MTSSDLTTVGLAAIGAAGVLIPAAVAMMAKVLPSIAVLITQVQELKERVNRHGVRLDGQDQTIAKVALATVPPTATPPPQS